MCIQNTQRLVCSGFGDAWQVSFGEGQMGMSLKNVEGRAEVSKVEKGEVGSAWRAAFVKHSGASLIRTPMELELGCARLVKFYVWCVRWTLRTGIRSLPRQAKPYLAIWTSLGPQESDY